MSLIYSTLFAVVPLIAVAFAVLQAFGYQQEIGSVLNEFLKTKDGEAFAAVGEPVYDTDLLGTGAGIGIRKGDTALKEKFDAALAAIIASGEYKTINETYIPVDIAPK